MNNNTIRITYDKEKFNTIVDIINNIYLNNQNEELKNNAHKLKEKLLTYSNIKENKVNIYLYNSEARFVINALSNLIENKNSVNDWIGELLNRKEEYKRKRGDK